MTFRLDPEKYGEHRAKVQFTTAAWMPMKVYRACQKTGIISNTRYYQIAVCEKLARDLGLDLDELLATLPKSRGPGAALFDPDNHPQRRTKKVGEGGDNTGGRLMIGPANTFEEVD